MVCYGEVLLLVSLTASVVDAQLILDVTCNNDTMRTVTVYTWNARGYFLYIYGCASKEGEFDGNGIPSNRPSEGDVTFTDCCIRRNVEYLAILSSERGSFNYTQQTEAFHFTCEKKPDPNTGWSTESVISVSATTSTKEKFQPFVEMKFTRGTDNKEHPTLQSAIVGDPLRLHFYITGALIEGERGYHIRVTTIEVSSDSGTTVLTSEGLQTEDYWSGVTDQYQGNQMVEFSAFMLSDIRTWTQTYTAVIEVCTSDNCPTNNCTGRPVIHTVNISANLRVMPYEGTSTLSVYNTPASLYRFDKFTITNAIPSDGLGSSSPIQSPVVMGYSSVVFQFRGFGNALLLFKRDDNAERYGDVFMVKIGGGGDYSRIGIHVSANPGASDEVAAIDIANVTSELEFRWFWVSWNTSSQTVSFGSGVKKNENILLSRSPIYPLTFEVTSLAISADVYNSGEWIFPSAAGRTTSFTRNTPEPTTVLPLFSSATSDVPVLPVSGTTEQAYSTKSALAYTEDQYTNRRSRIYESKFTEFTTTSLPTTVSQPSISFASPPITSPALIDKIVVSLSTNQNPTNFSVALSSTPAKTPFTITSFTTPAKFRHESGVSTSHTVDITTASYSSTSVPSSSIARFAANNGKSKGIMGTAELIAVLATAAIAIGVSFATVMVYVKFSRQRATAPIRRIGNAEENAGGDDAVGTQQT